MQQLWQWRKLLATEIPRGTKAPGRRLLDGRPLNIGNGAERGVDKSRPPSAGRVETVASSAQEFAHSARRESATWKDLSLTLYPYQVTVQWLNRLRHGTCVA